MNEAWKVVHRERYQTEYTKFPNDILCCCSLVGKLFVHEV